MREHNRVDPLSVAAVGLALHPLADEAGPFRVPDRAVVERVALELEPVEVEVEDQMPLKEARGFVRERCDPDSRGGPPSRRGWRSDSAD